MSSIDERIKALEERLKQEKAKKAKLDARRKSAQAMKERAIETRRKILIGAIILAKVERGDWSRDKLLDLLDASLTRADDRALFGLEVKSDGQQA